MSKLPFLQLATVLSIAVSPLEAAAVSAVFDFDDFPYYLGPFSGPEWEEPYSYAYGCDGKDHCTGRDVYIANNVSALGALSTVSTTRNGIFMELGRSEFIINYNGRGDIVHGDDVPGYDLFLLDFDTPLRSFSAKFARPNVVGEDCEDDGYGNDVCTEVYELLRLYLRSEPGSQGELVGSLTITPYDLISMPPGFEPLTVSLVSDTPYLSVNIGKAISYDPDCIVGGCGFPTFTGPDFSFDDIVVSTVPEPSTLLLLGIGFVVLGIRSRIR